MRNLLTILLLVLATLESVANTYHTKRLARVAQAIKLNLPDTLGSNKVYPRIITYQGKPLCVRTNEWGDIAHIGYDIVSREMADAMKATEVMEFIGRYLLELDLRLDGRSPYERMRIDQVVMVEGDVSQLRNATPETPVSVEEITRRMYRVTWTFGKKNAVMTIPADCQLILGADAVELEEMACRNLRRTVPMADFDLRGVDALLQRPGVKTQKTEGMVIVDGGKYLSELIRGDIYLTENRGKRKLLCSPQSPTRSVGNIMLTGISEHDIPLNLTVDKYGYKADSISITLQQLVAFCQAEGCKLYFGVKTQDERTLKGTLFALNEKLAYNHVFAVEFPLAILKGEECGLRGTLYCYIPLQNVTEKFFNQDLK